MSDPQQRTPEDILQLRIDLLFHNYVEQEPADDLRTISEFFEFLSQRLHYDRRMIDAPRGLLTRFESVCLLLRDRLGFYPETIKAQVDAILTEATLERTFAVLGTLSDEDLRRLRMQNSLQRLISAVPFFFSSHNLDIDGVPNRKAMFDAKIALNRLSQIVRYASGIEMFDHDAGLDEMREHYNPDLVEKAKLVALANLLRMQLRGAPDVAVRDRLLARLDRLEQEVGRSRPRWGRIIAGFFVILGVAADLKSVNPSAYDAIYRTVEAIVQTIHLDGSVEHHRQRSQLPLPESRSVALLPERVRVREEDDEA